MTRKSTNKIRIIIASARRSGYIRNPIVTSKDTTNKKISPTVNACIINPFFFYPVKLYSCKIS
ncbi:MAG: hypothetical protein V1674_03295 [Candidatus Omnitrophota bacterium]